MHGPRRQKGGKMVKTPCMAQKICMENKNETTNATKRATILYGNLTYRLKWKSENESTEN